MTATRIDGKAFAARLRERVGEAALGFAEKAGRKPGLAVVLVGEDAASQVYVRPSTILQLIAAPGALQPTSHCRAQRRTSSTKTKPKRWLAMV